MDAPPPIPEWTGVLLAALPGSDLRGTAFALTTLSPSYVAYPALTTARLPDQPYAFPVEQTTVAHVDDLRSWSQLFHRFTRDSAEFVFDRQRLTRMRDGGRLPVACIDDEPGCAAFERESAGWLPVLLWTPPECADDRRAWDRAHRQLARDPLRYALVIRSDLVSVVQAAQMVTVAVQGGRARSRTEEARIWT